MTGYINASNWFSWIKIHSLQELSYGTTWDTNRNSASAPLAWSQAWA